MEKVGVDIQKAISILNDGGVVAIPTETVYGLAANALNENAVRKIFKIKKRPAYDPLIVHTNELNKVKPFLKYIPQKARILSDKFWPGPLTIIFELKKDSRDIPGIVTSDLNTVGIRIPNHPLTLPLLEQIPYPLAAPSANPFGYVSPTCAMHVYDMMGDKVDYILDGGPCNVGLESTIVSFCDKNDRDKKTIIYRVGGVTIEQIEDVIGKVEIKQSTSNPKKEIMPPSPLAPGMLDSHYAPKIPLIQGNIDTLIKQHENKKVILITYFSKRYSAPNIVKNYNLSDYKNGSDISLQEAAKNLFAILRSADKYINNKANQDSKDLYIIFAEIFPNKGLGIAINDRLRRASRINV